LNRERLEGDEDADVQVGYDWIRRTMDPGLAGDLEANMATATELESEVEVESPIIEPGEHYEVVDGVIVEEPPLGVYEVRMASRIVRSMILFDPTGGLGEVVFESLFILNHSPGLRRKPDVAFVSRDRWPIDSPESREAAWDVVPDLAVEITSPTDLIDDLMDKLEEYFVAGVRLVWVIYPKHRKIYAYDSPTSVRILRIGDELDGGVVLPGFRLSLTALFELR
jgi:Uma2 family endonuclease